MQVTPDDLKPASYNPRKMSDEAKAGLKASMESFNDISGITWNKNTGNIVAGHHRWANLVEEYGLDHLKMKHIKGTDRHAIFETDSKSFTGFLLRVVDWDEATEKAANITANSPAIEGKFTKELQNILGELEESLDEVLYTKVNLGELKVKVPDTKINTDDVSDKKSQKSETAISAGGEKYKLVKLELSLELAKRFGKQLARFKKKAGNSVEKPLEVILNFLEAHDDDTILKHTKIERRKRRK
jgi:hypothetical protein